jgi:hypothetical protein
LAALGFQAD